MNKNYSYYLDELYDYLKYVVMMEEEEIDNIITNKELSEKYYKEYTEYTGRFFNEVLENKPVTVTDGKKINPITYSNINQLCHALKLPKVAVVESLTTGRPFQGLMFFYRHTFEGGISALLQAVAGGEIKDSEERCVERICFLMKSDSLLWSKVWFKRDAGETTAYLKRQYNNELGDVDVDVLQFAVTELIEQVGEFMKYDKK